MDISEIIIAKNEGLNLSTPYIIAEAGVNHEGSMKIAQRLIEEATDGGADAIKFQAYKAETIASKYSPAYWDTDQEAMTNQFDLFKKHDKFWKNDFEKLKIMCDDNGIEFMCTPFDFKSALFLNDMVKVFKISSSDITNKPFIEYISKFGKPIILSTGASNLDEITLAVRWIQKTADNPLALLHCILNYPTKEKNAHLGGITGLNRSFPELITGYSDHTLPKDMEILVVATLLGAKIIEKHFTHDKSLPGNDHYHAMDKNDLLYFKKRLERIISLIGDNEINYLPEEEISRKNARRSIVATKDLSAGYKLKEGDVEFKRPALGISPAEYDKVLGKIVKNKIKADKPLKWEDLDLQGD